MISNPPHRVHNIAGVFAPAVMACPSLMHACRTSDPTAWLSKPCTVRCSCGLQQHTLELSKKIGVGSGGHAEAQSSADREESRKAANCREAEEEAEAERILEPSEKCTYAFHSCKL